MCWRELVPAGRNLQSRQNRISFLRQQPAVTATGIHHRLPRSVWGQETPVFKLRISRAADKVGDINSWRGTLYKTMIVLLLLFASALSEERQAEWRETNHYVDVFDCSISSSKLRFHLWDVCFFSQGCKRAKQKSKFVAGDE
jgi:hypothetical protein